MHLEPCVFKEYMFVANYLLSLASKHNSRATFALSMHYMPTIVHENNSYCTDSRRDFVFICVSSCRVQAVYIVRASCRPLIPSVGSSSCLQSSALCQPLLSALQSLLRTFPPPLQTEPWRLHSCSSSEMLPQTILCYAVVWISMFSSSQA